MTAPANSIAPPALPARPGRRTLARAAALVGVVLVFYLAAAASFAGYFGKWAFLDGPGGNSLREVEAGTALRPFVYRQLLPALVGRLVDALPADSRAALEQRAAALRSAPDRIYARASDARAPGFTLKYVLLYHLVFASFLAALWLLRRLALAAGQPPAAATLGVLLFALVYPVLLTEGGYFYDMPELLFLAAALLAAQAGRGLAVVAITLLACLNKESFLFFLPTLYPLLRQGPGGRRQALATLAAAAAVALAANLGVKWHFAANDGQMAFWQPLQKLAFLLDPRSYLRMETNYGLPTPKGLHLLYLLCVVALVRQGWRGLPRALQAQARLAACINIPLFLLFSQNDELRNLSFLFPTFALLLGPWAVRALGPGLTEQRP